MTQRIVITGWGMIWAGGHDAASTLTTFHHNQRPVTPPASTCLDTTLTCPVFRINHPLPVLPEPYARSRSLALAMHAVTQAMTQAGLDPHHLQAPARVGVCVGTSVACQLNSVAFYQGWRDEKKLEPQPVLDYVHANLGRSVSTLVGAQGPQTTIVNACSSGADAITAGAQWIRAGLCDIVIVGGADELHRVSLAGFHSLGVVSSQPCRPFDANREGLNLGEGAGFLVLESQAHAEARSRSWAIELAGAGAACDAHHLTAPHPQGRGLVTAIKQALSQANINPRDIAFVNAHGTATLDNDRVESTALANLLGQDMPMFSTKGYTGHTLGAAGGLEAVFSLLALDQQWIPASMGFDNPADDAPLHPVQQRTAITGDYALSTSLAFGGNNAAILLKRVRHG